MPNNPKKPDDQPKRAAPHVRAPLWIGFWTVALIAFGLGVSGLLFHVFAGRRPMQSMQPLGLLAAPNLRPLDRFPQPGVDVDDDHGQMAALRAEQMTKLDSYGWVDRSNRLVHLPIDRAIDLIVQRGLPVASDTATNVPPLRLASEKQQP